jgi:hypothetical protein
MSDEARSMWEKFITAPANAALLKRYANCAKEPKALYDRIGEDLDSSNEAIRNKAYWALVLLTPELINLLHEKETHNPGWKDREGKDQKMVNEGLDGSKCILKHLHTKFVKEHRFKVLDGKKDPRPFLKKIIKNWERDEKRKREREVSLDYEAALEIPDPAGSPEDYIIETQTYDDLWREYQSYFATRDKFDLFYTFNVDDSLLEVARERWNIPSDNAVSQKKSRINKEIIARRDALSSFLIITASEFARTGKIPRHPQTPEVSEEWAQRTKRSVQPGAWANGKVPDGKNAIAVRALTRGLRRAPAHIYLVVVHRNEVAPWHKWDPFWVHVGFSRTKVPLPLNEHIQKVINPTGEFQRSLFTHRLLEAYPTELPGLNEALGDANVLSDYYGWLISNSLPDRSYYS